MMELRYGRCLREGEDCECECECECADGDEGVEDPTAAAAAVVELVEGFDLCMRGGSARVGGREEAKRD